MSVRFVMPLLVLALLVVVGRPAVANEPEAKGLETSYGSEIRPLLATYCRTKS